MVEIIGMTLLKQLFARLLLICQGIEKVNFDRRIDDHDVGDLIDDTAKGRASFLSTSFVFL